MGHHRSTVWASPTEGELANKALCPSLSFWRETEIFGRQSRTQFDCKPFLALSTHNTSTQLSLSQFSCNRQTTMESHGAGSYFVDEKAVLVENIFFDFLKRLVEYFSALQLFDPPSLTNHCISFQFSHQWELW